MEEREIGEKKNFIVIVFSFTQYNHCRYSKQIESVEENEKSKRNTNSLAKSGTDQNRCNNTSLIILPSPPLLFPGLRNKIARLIRFLSRKGSKARGSLVVLFHGKDLLLAKIYNLPDRNYSRVTVHTKKGKKVEKEEEKSPYQRTIAWLHPHVTRFAPCGTCSPLTNYTFRFTDVNGPVPRPVIMSSAVRPSTTVVAHIFEEHPINPPTNGFVDSYRGSSSMYEVDFCDRYLLFYFSQGIEYFFFFFCYEMKVFRS